MGRYIFAFLIIVLSGCEESIQQKEADSGKDGWLKGNTSEKFNHVANQLRGFDMTMVETGYRYQELYWAGQDQNWNYALYQIQKIKKTIENGLERRPKRAGSAQDFFEVSIPKMENAINTKDSLNFNSSFNLFTNACNRCHSKEGVPFFTVRAPIYRQSPIGK